MIKTAQQLTANDEIRTLTSQEIEIGKQVLLTNMGLKSSESLLIITDPTMLQSEAAIWFQAGKTITNKVEVQVISGMTQNAQEPPEKVVKKMTKADVIILQTTFSLSHTAARHQACQAGARVASLPTVNTEIIFRTLSIDYSPIAELSITLSNILTAANSAHLTSPAGTNISFDLSSRAGIDDTGFYTKPGDFGNLPAGESFIAPLEGTSNGTFVVDGSFADLQLDAPLTFTVKDGSVTSLQGGEAAKALNHTLTKLPETAKNIAELGIGVNHAANPKGLLIEAEKAYGTVHIAIGNNATIGGLVDVPFHSDGVILNPTLKLDGQIVVDQGQITI